MASRATKVLLALSIILLLPPAAAKADRTDSPSLNGVFGITHGAHIRPVYLSGTPDWGYGDEILAFDDLVGKDIGVVMYFAEWLDAGGHALDPFLLGLVQSEITDPSRRPVIMLTWEPTRSSGGSFGCTKSYSGPIPPQDIIDGNCDAYLVQFATDIKARPERYSLALRPRDEHYRLTMVAGQLGFG